MPGDGNASTASPISWCHSGARCIAPWRDGLRHLPRAKARSRQGSRAGACEASVQRRRFDLVLDALVMIEPLDRMIELAAFLLGKLGFHLGDRLGELGAIELLDRGRDFGEQGQAIFGNLGNASEDDDLLDRKS